MKYIDTPEGLIQVPMTYEESLNVKAVFTTWNALPGELGQYRKYGGLPVEVYLLVMKKNAKELDERYFDKNEKAAFDEADIEEWRQWVRKEAVQTTPLSFEESAKNSKGTNYTSTNASCENK